MLAIWLKGICLKIAADDPTNEHAASLVLFVVVCCQLTKCSWTLLAGMCQGSAQQFL